MKAAILAIAGMSLLAGCSDPKETALQSLTAIILGDDAKTDGKISEIGKVQLMWIRDCKFSYLFDDNDAASKKPEIFDLSDLYFEPMSDKIVLFYSPFQKICKKDSDSCWKRFSYVFGGDIDVKRLPARLENLRKLCPINEGVAEQFEKDKTEGG
jgi:hypothetical protein